jgi:hypothetical protein
VEQSVEREHAQFGRLGVAGGFGLPARDAACDDNVTQMGCGTRVSPGRGRHASVIEARERQDVCRVIVAEVLPVQRTDASVRNYRDADRATGACGGHGGEPARQGGTEWAPPLIGGADLQSWTRATLVAWSHGAQAERGATADGHAAPFPFV